MAIKTINNSILTQTSSLESVPAAPQKTESNASAAAQNALYQMQITTSQTSPPSATIPSQRIHKFETKITIRGETYLVTSDLRYNEIFNKGKSLENSLAPLLGQAIEAATNEMPHVNEFILSCKEEGILSTPLKELNPDPILIKNSAKLSKEIRDILDFTEPTLSPPLRPNLQPTLLQRASTKFSKAVQATIDFMAPILARTPSLYSSIEQIPVIRFPLGPDLLPKKETAQPAPLPLFNSSGANCYAAALLQIISTNPVMNRSLIEGLKTSQPNLSTLLSAYEKARLNRSASFPIEELEAVLNQKGKAETQDLVELLEQLIKSSTAADDLKPALLTTTTYRIPKNIPLPPHAFKRIDDQTVLQTSVSENSGIPCLGLSLPETGNLTLQSVIERHCSLKNPGNFTTINGKQYHAVHAIDQFSSPPPVLVLHLQRSIAQGSLSRINQTLVEAPERMILPKSLLVKKETPDEEYQLRSFSVRTGDSPASGGHFISYVKTKGMDGATEHWICNNSSITKIDSEKFLEAAQHAYSLIYNKVAPEDRTLLPAN